MEAVEQVTDIFYKNHSTSVRLEEPFVRIPADTVGKFGSI